MKVTVATKPFSDGLNLGIVPGNISRFYKRSCVVQLLATRTDLVVNIETSQVATQLGWKCRGDEDGPVRMFVDSDLLRSLMSTIDSTTVDLEFTEGGLVIHAGKSEFKLAKQLDETECEFEPLEIDALTQPVPINKDHWKFIKEHQMYARALSFIHPVYTTIWVSEDGKALVGDYDNSMFTGSDSGDLGLTCLLSDTIVNLINSLPAGAKLYKQDDVFTVTFETDSYTYATQFKPEFEDGATYGSYSADIIQAQLSVDSENAVVSDNKQLSKFIGQSTLLSTSSEDTIKLAIQPGKLRMKDSHIDCELDVEGPVSSPYELEFRVSLLKLVLSHLDDDAVTISPACADDGTPVGVVFSTKNMAAVLGSVD